MSDPWAAFAPQPAPANAPAAPQVRPGTRQVSGDATTPAGEVEVELLDGPAAAPPPPADDAAPAADPWAAFSPPPAVHSALRPLGLATRDGIEGVGELLGFLIDSGVTLANLPSTLIALASPQSLQPAPQVSLGVAQRASSKLADLAGLPQAENTTERVGSRINRELASTLTTMGWAKWALKAGQLAAEAPQAVVDLGRWAMGRRTAMAGRRGATSTGEHVARTLAEAPGSQLTGAIGSGAAGAAVQEGVSDDNPAKPLLELGASVLGGAVGATTASVGSAALRTGEAAVAPLHRGGQERIIGTYLRQSAADPVGALARLRQALEDGPRVPGSLPTTGEAAGDSGLLQQERALRNSGDSAQRSRFESRDIDRDRARTGALDGLQPGTESIDTVRDRVQFEHASRQEQAEQQIAAAEATLPAPISLQEAGATIRGAAEAGHTAAKAATRRAYGAIRPDLQIPLAPIRAAAAEVAGRYATPLTPDMPAELAQARDVLAGYGGGAEHATADWEHLQALYSKLGEDAGKARMAGDNRLAAALERIRSRIMHTADIASEPYRPDGRPRTLEELEAAEAEQGAGAHPDIARRLELPPEELLARVDAENHPEGLSLVQFLRRLGGIQDQGGDVLAAMGGRHGAMPALISGRGLTLEQATQAAFEQGYLRGNDGTGAGPMGADINDLLDAIDLELRGLERRHPRGQVVVRDNRRGQTVEDDLDREIHGRGGDYRPGDRAGTLRSLRPPEGEAAGPAEEPLVIPPEHAMSPEDAAAWRAAQATRREQGRLFERGAMGQVTRRNQFGDHELPESAIPGQFFHSRPGGPEAVAQFIEGMGGRSEAIEALQRYAAQSLRDYASRPNVEGLDPSRVTAWLTRHRDALAAFPELAERFATVQRAVQAAGNATSRVTEIEKGAARYFLKEDPETALKKVLRSGNSIAEARELVRLVGGDQPALRGLRRGYIALLQKQIESTTLAAAEDGTDHARQLAGKAAVFLKATEPAARQFFTPEQLADLRAIVRDYQRGKMWATAGHPGNSTTAQSLSMAYLLGRATNGALDLNGLSGRLTNNTLGWLVSISSRLPAQQIQALLFDAMLDPAVAARLMEKATPASTRAFENWARREGPASVKAALGAATTRGVARATGSVAQQRDGEGERHADGGAVGLDDYLRAAGVLQGNAYGEGGLVRSGLRVFHGSPHEFDRFDLSRIGSGEGHQAFGRGLYFAENEHIARHYRDTLSRGRENPEWIAARQEQLAAQREMNALHMRMVDESKARGAVTQDPEWGDLGIVPLPEVVAENQAAWEVLKGRADAAHQRLLEVPRLTDLRGHMYEVELGVDRPSLMDYDRPLVQQPGILERLQAADLSPLARVDSSLSGKSYQIVMPGGWVPQGVPDFFRSRERAETALERFNGTFTGADAVPHDPAKMERLRDAGIPGLQYLDAGSRNGLGDSRNVVMFDDAPISILRRYAEGGQVAGLNDADSYGEGGIVRRGIRAFHGSPHKFDRFSLEHIGSGEGAQVYGHGLYFAGDEAVARHYRDRLQAEPSRGLGFALNGEELGWASNTVPERLRHGMTELHARLSPYAGVRDAAGMAELVERERDALRRTIRNYEASHARGQPFMEPTMQWSQYKLDDAKAALEALETPGFQVLHPRDGSGAMYEVELGVDRNQLLDWDKPLARQSEPVRESLARVPWADAYLNSERLTGGQIMPHTADGARQLREAGIPGLQYLDAGSRAAGEGSHNFVMFDDSPIQILRRYLRGGLVGQPQAGLS